MEHTLIDNQTRDQFISHFGNLELAYQKISLGRGSAHAFSVTLDNVSTLGEIWQNISNFIAMHFQTKISDNFGKYNFYLFYIVLGNISNELKYKIENNTFSSRKIIVTEKEVLSSLVNSHILNNDLTISHDVAVVVDSFRKNEQLWNMLQGRVLKGIRVTNAATDTYNELLKLKKEDQDEIQED
ncbi:hypothetical protein SAMN05428949_6501 [Chitinophaga sp. YR627]|uniref:ABC-three component system middle component 1 n=1 Tax=Chitinophaga sp. YR627 TaxID=1881041 RepID=UPI0008F0739B|nr:ABC-three component system middle component 1 [Chitinophaga sp. YR627]SFO75655.1 hypothetical protein SAMN05428949_6501 [Chitinophaga sp. YR627]